MGCFGFGDRKKRENKRQNNEASGSVKKDDIICKMIEAVFEAMTNLVEAVCCGCDGGNDGGHGDGGDGGGGHDGGGGGISGAGCGGACGGGGAGCGGGGGG